MRHALQQSDSVYRTEYKEGRQLSELILYSRIRINLRSLIAFKRLPAMGLPQPRSQFLLLSIICTHYSALFRNDRQHLLFPILFSLPLPMRLSSLSLVPHNSLSLSSISICVRIALLVSSQVAVHFSNETARHSIQQEVRRNIHYVRGYKLQSCLH